MSRVPETNLQAAPAANAPAATNTASANGDPVLVGAGDVASCNDLAGAKATAKLLESIPGTVFVAAILRIPTARRRSSPTVTARLGDDTSPARGPHPAITSSMPAALRLFRLFRCRRRRSQEGILQLRLGCVACDRPQQQLL